MSEGNSPAVAGFPGLNGTMRTGCNNHAKKDQVVVIVIGIVMASEDKAKENTNLSFAHALGICIASHRELKLI